MKIETRNINILLIEDSPDYAELVTQWLSSGALGQPCHLSWTDSLAFGLKRLAEQDMDLVLLDLDLPDSRGLATFTAVRSCAPDVPVVILSAADSESLALQTIQEGAENYLVKSSCTMDLMLRAVCFAVVRHRTQASKRTEKTVAPPRVAGVIGATGGVGATTLACNLAQELQQQTGDKVLLADLDLQTGSVAFQMGLEPKYSVLDAVRNVERLDATYLEGIVTHAERDLPILASPAFLGSADLDAGNLLRVIGLARSMYRWSVLDLGPLNCNSRRLLNSTDELIVVTTCTIPVLYDTKRMIDGLITAGMPPDRIRLILNKGEEWQAWQREVKQMFGVQVQACLPTAGHDLHESYLKGRSLPQNSKIRQEIARFAGNLAGLSHPPSKRGVFQFLRFLERPRKAQDSQGAASPA
jgi:Flp pilus assembly CpaE family ATPase